MVDCVSDIIMLFIAIDMSFYERYSDFYKHPERFIIIFFFFAIDSLGLVGNYEKCNTIYKILRTIYICQGLIMFNEMLHVQNYNIVVDKI